MVECGRSGESYCTVGQLTIKFNILLEAKKHVSAQYPLYSISAFLLW